MRIFARILVFTTGTVAYDLDQIILRSEIPVVEAFNKKHKTFYHWYEHGWNSMTEWLRKDFGYSDDRIEQEYKDLWENADILSNAPIIRPTLEFIYKMKILGKRQLIITSRKPHLYDSTVKLLEKEHVFDLIPRQNFFLNPSGSIPGVLFKGRIIKEQGVDVMVEDSLPQIDKIMEIICDVSQPTKTKIFWVPSGPDIYLRKNKDPNVIKIPNIELLPHLVAQSY